VVVVAVPSSTAASLGLSTVVHDIRVGIAGKYAEERSSQARAGRGAVDLGLAQDVWGGTLALAVQNIGPRLRLGDRRASLPLRTTLGFKDNEILLASGKTGQEALEAIGDAYHATVLSDPRRLQGQMQAYAACDDPDVREVVRSLDEM